jgi:hypothetical protein
VGARRKRVADAHAALEPPAAAKLARLHHTTDDRPGITRHKARSGFDYRRPDGALIGDLTARHRIKSLVIPPAWTAVWINPDPLGHIQVTGRDQRGRKQYRYHPRWREVRYEAKYGKMLLFARVLPLIVPGSTPICGGTAYLVSECSRRSSGFSNSPSFASATTNTQEPTRALV